MIIASQQQPSPASPASASPTSSRRFQIPFPENKQLLERMEKANEEQLKKFDEQLEIAQKNEGESEIGDALRARAQYLTRIGEKVRFTRLDEAMRSHSRSLIHTGESHRSTRACVRKDSWCGFKNRYRPHARPCRFLLRRPPHDLQATRTSGRVSFQLSMPFTMD